MPLYKAKFSFEVVVDAPDMWKALDLAIDASRSDRSIPATGMASLLTKPSQVPRSWLKRRPAGAVAGPLCVELLDKKRKAA